MRSSRRLMLWFGFWACLVVLGLGLGLWQWERAADKRELLARYDSAPRLVAPESAPPDGAWISVSGEFLAKETLFLDNRIHGERLGVAALTPLRGDDGRLWLVERGFLPTGPSRETPRVSTPESRVSVAGRWQVAGDSAPLFGPNREGKRLQHIALDAWEGLGDSPMPAGCTRRKGAATWLPGGSPMCCRRRVISAMPPSGGDWR
ncbi:SURF1 family protein [Halomonas elongata]|uniref:SURF1-like protein n=1 Tax=Halomonas elongata TaxID=2746 RepID=A0A1B8P2K2_HALEL|nr:SURF1 family protein [Halomonas elongata]OBX36484.1 SURF1 family protein [Halomonas elongata]